jgi:hypothetical protein
MKYPVDFLNKNLAMNQNIITLSFEFKVFAILYCTARVLTQKIITLAFRSKVIYVYID